MVTTMLAKTSAYVRRTSVPRSTPLRIGNVLTAGLYEKPMASSDSVGEFDENIYPAPRRKSRALRQLRGRRDTGRGGLGGRGGASGVSPEPFSRETFPFTVFSTTSRDELPI